jgi:C1A family cysteine protease
MKNVINSVKKLIGMNQSKVYGYKRDSHDARDIMFSLPTATDPSSLPAMIDLRPGCPPVYNQGNLGSCTANALAAAVEFDQLKENSKWDFMPSRLFIYYNERALEGSIKRDAGAAIRDGIKTINTQGVCKEALCPYIERNFAKKPYANAYAEAILHKSISYRRLDNTNIGMLKACLANGSPFVFGFMVYDSFESDQVAQTGIMSMPQPNEKCLGGHAVMCVGYDDTKNVFIVRNSWSSDWGDKGYFYMPYDYMTSARLSSDFWTIESVTTK